MKKSDRLYIVRVSTHTRSRIALVTSSMKTAETVRINEEGEVYRRDGGPVFVPEDDYYFIDIEIWKNEKKMMEIKHYGERDKAKIVMSSGLIFEVVDAKPNSNRRLYPNPEHLLFDIDYTIRRLKEQDTSIHDIMSMSRTLTKDNANETMIETLKSIAREVGVKFCPIEGVSIMSNPSEDDKPENE